MSEIKKQLEKTTIYLFIDGEIVSETLMSEDSKSLLKFFKKNGGLEKIRKAENFYFALDNFFSISISEEYATIENLAYIFHLVKMYEDKAVALFKSKDFNASFNFEVVALLCAYEFLGVFDSKDSFFTSLKSDDCMNEQYYLFCDFNKQLYIFNNDFEKYEYGYDHAKQERDYYMAQMGMIWCYESKEYI